MSTNPNRRSSLSLENMDEIEKVFKRFDSNGDGKISGSELGDVLNALGSSTSPEEIRKMMDEIDKDGDGFIDLKEFADFHRGSGDVSGELRDAFEMYDLDKNGLISAKELHMVLRKLGEKCSIEECTRMICSVDSDGDGSVNFEEFKKMMTNSNASAH
ncbi:calcium-binding EF-hand family protein [Tasmannia lanceolata]|uniref:calcium-binding EF-hand family protein n=1 Tax=Tasmannia lanceolata TaxID=3420 RepID=UPI004063F226